MAEEDLVAERLRAAAKVAERRPLGFGLEDIFREGSARRRRPGPWRRRAVVSAVAAAVLIVFFVPLPHLGVFGHLVTSGKPSPAASSKGPSALTAVSHGPWPESLLAHANFAPRSSIAVPSPQSSGPIILGFENNGCMEPCPAPIARLDPRSGTIKLGPVMTAGSFLETVANKVIVFTPQRVSLDGEVSGGWFLRTVDTSSLQLGRAMRLHVLGNSDGFDATPGVRGTEDVWIDDVLANNRPVLVLLDTATGKILHTVRTGDVDSLELSPDGRILYELGTASTSASERESVTEMNAFTGRILATRRQSFSGGTVGIVPVPRGVWVTSYEPSVSLLSSDVLRPLALPKGALPPDPPAGANIWRGFTAYNLGPFVLLQSYRGMTCDAPNTGATRATALWAAKQAPGWSPLALDGHSLIAAQITSFASSAIFAVHIPTACFS